MWEFLSEQEKEERVVVMLNLEKTSSAQIGRYFTPFRATILKAIEEHDLKTFIQALRYVFYDLVKKEIDGRRQSRGLGVSGLLTVQDVDEVIPLLLQVNPREIESLANIWFAIVQAKLGHENWTRPLENMLVYFLDWWVPIHSITSSNLGEGKGYKEQRKMLWYAIDVEYASLYLLRCFGLFLRLLPFDICRQYGCPESLDDPALFLFDPDELQMWETARETVDFEKTHKWKRELLEDVWSMWTPNGHRMFPYPFRKAIWGFLLVRERLYKSKVPKDIVVVICTWTARLWRTG